MSNIFSVRKHIDNGEYDELVSKHETEIISANFYEALCGLNLDAEDADVEFIAQWSPVVKKNRCPQNRVILSHDYYQPISNTISKLKNHTKQAKKIVGRIKRLESAPEVAQRTSGKITVVYLDDNGNKKNVVVNLSKEDYDKALQAHSEGNYVEILGELTGTHGNSLTCESFNIIE